MKLMSLATVLVLLLAACGGDDGDELETDLSVSEILANASERLAGTDSMRFSMEVEGETFIDPTRTMRLLNAKGTMARPDSVDVQFQIEALGTQTVSIRMITIGAESWTTDIVTGRWVTAPAEFGYNPAILYDNQDGLGPVMGKIEQAEIVGTEQIGDREAYHVRGTSPGEVIESLTAGTMDGEQIGVELWVDGETWDLLRVIVREPDDSASEHPATWTMNLSRHDDEATIAPPG
jgi:outer membrane lipoprotein-sorting protein